MRRSGQTTRIIDAAIQTLFTKGEVTLQDHHFGERGSIDTAEEANIRATDFAFRNLLGRLNFEHGGIGNFVIDKNKFTVKIKLCAENVLE